MVLIFDVVQCLIRSSVEISFCGSQPCYLPRHSVVSRASSRPAVSHDILDFSARVLATDCVELPNGPTGLTISRYVGRVSRHGLFSGLAARGRTLTKRTTLDGDLSRSASLDRQQSLTKCKDFEASCLTHLHALTRSGPPDLRQFGARLRDRGCINFSEFGLCRTR